MIHFVGIPNKYMALENWNQKINVNFYPKTSASTISDLTEEFH